MSRYSVPLAVIVAPATGAAPPLPFDEAPAGGSSAVVLRASAPPSATPSPDVLAPLDDPLELVEPPDEPLELDVPVLRPGEGVSSAVHATTVTTRTESQRMLRS